MRVMKFIAPAAIVLSLAPVAIGSASAGTSPVGIWMNDTGRGAVEIKECGNALCGNVVWVKSSADADGCGKPILGNVVSVGGGRWDNGWIFSPERGRKYDVELTPLSSGKLKVVGYAGMKFLSKTMIWTPAPADLQLCTGTQAAKTPTATEAAKTPAPSTTPASAPVQQAAKTPDKSAPAATDKQAEAKPADTTKEAKAPAAAPEAAQENSKPAETAKADEPSDSASSGDDEGPAGGLGKLKIGDMQLDKVLTKTKDGKCKLDLPWIKVTLDCDR
jgi:uncharacterized protein (DUF2147 family)